MAETLVENLCKALSALQSGEEAKAFLEDLLSKDELETISIRLEIMRLLSVGMTRTEIQDHLAEHRRAPSLATISRANAVIKYGSGMISRILGRIESS